MPITALSATIFAILLVALGPTPGSAACIQVRPPALPSNMWAYYELRFVPRFSEPQDTPPDTLAFTPLECNKDSLCAKRGKVLGTLC